MGASVRIRISDSGFMGTRRAFVATPVGSGFDPEFVNVYRVRYSESQQWHTLDTLPQTSDIDEWLYFDAVGLPSIYWNSGTRKVILI